MRSEAEVAMNTMIKAFSDLDIFLVIPSKSSKYTKKNLNIY